ncbi:hypothetical protein IWQ56_007244, partial [Coemansia nantahalensis]
HRPARHRLGRAAAAQRADPGRRRRAGRHPPRARPGGPARANGGARQCRVPGPHPHPHGRARVGLQRAGAVVADPGRGRRAGQAAAADPAGAVQVVPRAPGRRRCRGRGRAARHRRRHCRHGRARRRRARVADDPAPRVRQGRRGHRSCCVAGRRLARRRGVPCHGRHLPRVRRWLCCPWPHAARRPCRRLAADPDRPPRRQRSAGRRGQLGRAGRPVQGRAQGRLRRVCRAHQPRGAARDRVAAARPADAAGLQPGQGRGPAAAHLLAGPAGRVARHQGARGARHGAAGAVHGAGRAAAVCHRDHRPADPDCRRPAPAGGEGGDSVDAGPAAGADPGADAAVPAAAAAHV